MHNRVAILFSQYFQFSTAATKPPFNDIMYPIVNIAIHIPSATQSSGILVCTSF